jgi:dephospho-CoA kinase
MRASNGASALSHKRAVTNHVGTMPIIIGVTGSIAAGKSLLCRYLVERHGAVHADADTVVHRMYDPGKPAFDRIVSSFGDDVVGADGLIDRRVLGGKVFGDTDKMAALRVAIGDIPAELFELMAHWRETLADDRVAVLEAVNLFEGEYMRRIDVGWLAAVDDSTAVTRLMARNNFSREQAEQRLASARPWQTRATAADHVFHNDATEDALRSEVDQVFRETVDAARAGSLRPARWQAWRRTQPAPKNDDLPPDERA